MMFSDSVPIEHEVEIKHEARKRGLMVMGPDCGTAIINGVPLAFANVVPRGDIGIIGASGTGIQEITCLIARAGHGISHAIGVGGRDLKAEVGGITTLMALDALDADPATRHVVLVSKPPPPAVAKAVLERIGQSPKPCTVCFLGGEQQALPANARSARLLRDAARLAWGGDAAPALFAAKTLQARRRGDHVRGLFSGGSLCAEAQVVLRDARLDVSSNVPIPGVRALAAEPDGHALIDLGDDEFTRGRPHPMIEPAVRDAPFDAAHVDATIGVILLDIVLGFGAHADPAGHLARRLSGRPKDGPLVVASVTGTEGDPQILSRQRRTLEEAGVHIAGSNAEAAEIALSAVTPYR